MAKYNNNFYRDSAPSFDASILQYSGGIGKGIASLGNSLAQVGQDKIDQQKYDDAMAFKNKQYADSRTDRTEDVQFRQNEATRNQNNINNDLQYKKDEAIRNQKNVDAQFNFTKEKYKDAEQKQSDSDASKAKTMREYLTKNGVDTSKYSDNDILYAGDNIEKTHLDKTDYKFAQVVYKDKTPYAMFKDSKGNTKINPIFGNGDTSSTASDEKTLQDREDFYNLKYKDYLDKKYGATANTPID